MSSNMSEKQSNTGETSSIWMEVEMPSFSPLQKDILADVCIIGTGIAGLTCAYTLAKQGKSVVLLEKGFLAGGETARTTAHLTWVLDDRFSDLVKLFGKEGAKMAAESHVKAIDYIESIVHKEKIDCDFERVSGYLFAPPEDKDTLNEELMALKDLNLPVSKAAKAPFSPCFETGPCLVFDNQAQFHIRKYLKGLVNSLLNMGVILFTGSLVKQVKDGSPCQVVVENGRMVQAQAVIVATCTPINNRFIIHTKQAAYRTYVIGASIPKNVCEKALYWDTLDPYHYIRLQNHPSNEELDWLIVGGEDHKTGQNDSYAACFERLERWVLERFPMIRNFEYHWSGQVYEPIDSLAFIGRNPRDRNIYIVTGDSGNGMTHGTIAGLLLPDLICNIANPWQPLYDPSRKNFKAINEFAKENLNAIVQYGDWLTSEDKQKIEQLPLNEGVIVGKGMKKVAVYKDQEGTLHQNSALCPHLGGCLRWNACEKSWDCPVHGSRFDGCGKAINGPASAALKESDK